MKSFEIINKTNNYKVFYITVKVVANRDGLMKYNREENLFHAHIIALSLLPLLPPLR